MNIWERVGDALSSINLPKGVNKYVVETGESLPDEYIVYFLVDSPNAQNADDVETMRTRKIQVSYYNIAGLMSMPDIESAMIAAGFSPSDQRELPYNEDSGHYGFALDFVFVE